jgi:hypothetical protein
MGYSDYPKKVINETLIVSIIGFLINLIYYFLDKCIDLSVKQHDMFTASFITFAFGFIHFKFNETMSFLYNLNPIFKPTPRLIKLMGLIFLIISLGSSTFFVYLMTIKV